MVSKSVILMIAISGRNSVGQENANPIQRRWRRVREFPTNGSSGALTTHT